jgi:predicted DNA repair protein MutK
MPAGAFLALLDDVAAAARVAAASADDIATLTALSTKKAGGIVVDDMAVTAGSMVGVDPGRELPIVWAVAKGSLFNKCIILIPAALVLSWLAPWSLTPLLMAGGAFLCFEGMEKVLHWNEPSTPHLIPVGADPVQLEKDKIRGAIQTDVILSAEVVALTLAGIKAADPMVRALTLYAVGFLMTVGVYGIVALLVKLDDMGMHFARQSGWRQNFGLWILKKAPGLFKVISIIGTVAMLLVGGGIIAHGLHLEQFIPQIPVVTPLINMVLSGGIGMATGWLVIKVLPYAAPHWARLKALVKK